MGTLPISPSSLSSLRLSLPLTKHLISGNAMERGMVLVMSLWDDNTANGLWLDSNYPTTMDPSFPGVARYGEGDRAVHYYYFCFVFNFYFILFIFLKIVN
jgi:Glycosyl hydrolase family 7